MALPHHVNAKGWASIMGASDDVPHLTHLWVSTGDLAFGSGMVN